MKLIHTADWHLGKNIEGHSRLEERRLFLNDFINICKDKSLYQTGIEIKDKEKLITLSTCEYSNKNSRLVIVARKIK